MPVLKCSNGKYRVGNSDCIYDTKTKAEEVWKALLAQGIYAEETYSDYPQAATENAKRAIKYAEENGWGSCGEATGKQRANQLANGENISRDTIARMASFKRHQQHKDVPYSEGCGGLMWDAWGGTEGIEWAQRKLEQIDNDEKFNKLNRLVELARIRVSFDYDDTLTLTKIENIVKRLITAGGTEVYIISSRDNAARMYALSIKLGIPMYRVFAEGSDEAKIEKIKELNIRTHYDNNPDVIREIPGIGKLI
jgi:uncharacterized protein (DUF433 family)